MSATRPIRVCLLGLDALPALSREHAHLGVAAGEPVQQSLLARALAARGYEVTLIVLAQGQLSRYDETTPLSRSQAANTGIRDPLG